MGFIPSGGLYASAIADYLAALTNKFTGVFPAAPGGVRLENQLLRWLANVFGYDSNLSSGNLTSGGSIANLMAVTAARDAFSLRAADYARAVFYYSSEVFIFCKGVHEISIHIRINIRSNILWITLLNVIKKILIYLYLEKTNYIG